MLRPISSYEGNKSFFRCDQCAHHRSYCDKTLPICGRCVTRQVECTLLRVIKNKRNHDSKIHSCQHQFRIKNNKSAIFNNKETSLNIIKYKVKSPSISNLNLFNVAESSINSTRQVLSRLVNKALAYNLYSITEFPPLNSLNFGLELFIQTAFKLKPFATQSKLILKRKQKGYANLNLDQFIEIGVHLYFDKYISQMFLFSKASFFSRKRSLFLKLCLALTGYSTQTLASKELELLNLLRYKLYNLLIKETFQPNFATLQGLLILSSEVLSEQWILYKTILFHGLIENITLLLGLHLNLSNKLLSINDIIERKLVLNFLSFRASLMTFSVRTITNMISDEDLVFKYDLFNLENPKLPSDYILLQDKFILSDFYGQMAPLLRQVSKYQQLALIEKSNLEMIKNQMNIISSNMKSISIQKLQLLYKIKTSNTLPCINVNFIIQQINIFLHYGLFRNYTLLLYIRPMLSQLESHSEFQFTFKACFQLFKTLIHTKNQDYQRMQIMILGQMLVFLMRYKHVSKDQNMVEIAIQDAYSILNKIQSIPVFHRLASLNMVIPDFIKQHYNKV